MFRHIARDEAGVSAPEYAVLLLLLVASLVVAIGALNGATTGLFNNAANGISDAGRNSGSPDGTSTASASSPTSGGSSSPTGPTSQPSVTPPSPTGHPHDPHGRDRAPGQEKKSDDTTSAKTFAPGQNK